MRTTPRKNSLTQWITVNFPSKLGNWEWAKGNWEWANIEIFHAKSIEKKHNLRGEKQTNNQKNQIFTQIALFRQHFPLRSKSWTTGSIPKKNSNSALPRNIKIQQEENPANMITIYSYMHLSIHSTICIHIQQKYKKWSTF